MGNEIWKPVVGPAGQYEISSWGRVRSIRNGKVRELRPWKTKDGYRAFRTGKRTLVLYVHQIVAKEFIGNCPKGNVVRHLDGNNQNNRLDNIAYGTRTDNINDAKRHGTWQNGGLKKFKLGLDTMRKIRRMYLSGEGSLQTLALLFSVGQTTIHNIARGKHATPY